MKKRLIFVSLLITLLLTFCFGINTAKGESLPDLSGNWLNEEYIDTLSKTRSPIKAARDVYEVYYRIKKKYHEYEWETIYNFHEGGPQRIIKMILPSTKKGHYQLWVQEYSNDNKNLILNKTDYKLIIEKGSNQRIIYYNAEEKERLFFSKIKSDDQSYVNSVVLAGKYQDSKGSIYEFTADRTALWPNQRFKYQVGLDRVFMKYDYFWVTNDTGKNPFIYYCYERKNDELFIYKGIVPDEGDWIEREELPFACLKKIK